jgi:hypothetical protein
VSESICFRSWYGAQRITFLAPCKDEKAVKYNMEGEVEILKFILEREKS